MKMQSLHVPLIDLERPEVHILDQLYEACTTSGFFVLKNHGIPVELRHKVLENCKRFFDLPEEQKLGYKSEVMYVGYQPYGEIKVDKENKQAKGDLREGHYACRGVPWVEDGGDEMWPEQWPPEDELPTFSQANKEYATASLQLTRRLFKLLSKVLKRPEGCLETMLQNPFVALHNLHYAPVKSEPENGIVGLGAHSDFGLLTLLTTDQPGLQINADEKWLDIKLDPNCLVVNLGDELQRCTNDKFKSMRHRVVSNGQDRYSVAFFVNADHDATLTCLPGCTSPDNPSKYEPISSSDFMMQKFSAAHST